MRYQIVGNDYDGTFAIDSSSGVVTLRKPIALLEGKRDFSVQRHFLDSIYTDLQIILVTPRQN